MKSAIVLDNGAVVASPLSIPQLLRNIDNASANKSQAKQVRLSNGLKVYDMIPDEVYDADPEDNYPEILVEEIDEAELAAGDTDGDNIVFCGEVDDDEID